MNLPNPIRLGSPGEDISTKDLNRITQRFINLNQARLQRIQSFLLARQRAFLDLLPLLFHQNHPLLPGFISLDTVMGIPNYTPNRQTILQAKSFSKQFNYKRRALREYPIQGIYLMGSVSSIAFTQHSDIDIWLCHTHDLLADEIRELQEKSTAIEKWADSLDLEVHFFLVDSEDFIKGGVSSPLSSESSGQTQHYLLLEEFYRTSIYIAGRTPMWWIVPPHEESNYNFYVRHLREKRFISDHEMIDFGSLEAIPAEEFVTATLWHLYKAINAPYKSLLKLLLMECYASEYPNPNWLSLEVKKAVYQGSFDLEAIDPYILIQKKIEKYLQSSDDIERLNFARQCFYLKVMGDIQQKPDSKKSAVRQEVIHNITKQQDWPEYLLPLFAKTKQWDIKKATLENDIIIRQLKQCYRIISQFSNTHTNSYTIKHQDIQLIGRKLKSFLQKRPGKIDIITTRSSIYNKENELSLIESRNQATRPVWSLYPGVANEASLQQATPFKKNAHSLVELLAWLVINGLYQQKLQLHIYSENYSLSQINISNTLTTLSRFLLNYKLGNLTDLSAFKQSNRVVANLLLINLGNTTNSHRTDGRIIISDRSDILSYGIEQENLVHTTDQISISHWGEVTTSRFLGLEGLFDCFIAIFNLNSQNVQLKISCQTPIRGNSIALGIKSLFKVLSSLFTVHSSTDSPRLIIAGGSDFYIFQQKETSLHYWKIINLDSLMTELARPQLIFSRVYFHDSTLNHTVIPFLYTFIKPHTITVFYSVKESQIHLYIIDEKGSFFQQCYSNSSAQQLLTAYSIFLETLYDKGILDVNLSIEYYELTYSNAVKYTTTKIILPTTLTWDYLSIRVTGEIINSPSHILYTLYCNDIEFSSSSPDEDNFKSVADYIYTIRQSKDQYPIHITEIDVPLQVLGVDNYEQLQSIHFLRYKQKIEARLNVK